MAGDQNPKFPLDDEAAGSTMLTVPRMGNKLTAPPPAPAAEAGGTMVQVPRIGTGAFKPPPPPLAPPDPEPGTMVGIGRIVPTAIPVAQPVFPPNAEPGGTMVAVPRPNFGGMAMPVAQPSAAPPPEPGGTMVGISRFGVPPPAPAAPPPDPGGTMIGIGRLGPSPAAFRPPEPDPGGTMVGVGRVMAPPGAFAHPAPDPGGTMVGVGRVMVPPGAFAPPAPDPGGTMVGVGRVMAAPMGQAFAPPEPDPGGTMVGIPVGGFSAPSVGAFAAPARPAGPPTAYDIVAHLGGGELGEVFHAIHKATRLEVAIRVFRPEIISVQGAVDALRDVVALAAAAQHTHLGKQLELDETATPSLIVEYVQGRQLAQILRERGAAPAPAVIDLGVRLCSALAAAHAAGLAHGRLHAGNVVLEAKTGRWVVLDLGHGYAVQGLEPAHDLYALGALLYEMATGHAPFEAGETAPDPRTHQPKLPASLSALLLRTLSPNPAVWFASAVEMAQALARAKTLP